MEPLGTLDIGLAGSLDTSHNVHPSVTPVDVTELSHLGGTSVFRMSRVWHTGWLKVCQAGCQAGPTKIGGSVTSHQRIREWKEPGGQNLNI